ncbi:RagB/SusD family nutrient uptake outer membrane protein [Pontimicrobium sp. SW4]|uniref:RagB/SusD family nutrient uptake outer membrane protein n=1 Tax=Pontimicrobium sp. SW4 TaxID=3153519 RepID=A0AAU7BRC9_9FLAO
MKTIKSILAFIIISSSFMACEDYNTDLEVDNIEDPNSLQLGTESTAQKLFQNWYFNANRYVSPSLAMATMSDMHSCSWGNAAMRDMSSEPRIAWNNDPAYSNQTFTNTFFNSMHVVLADANAIIASIDNGAIFSDNNKIKAIARMAQGLSVGYLALNFNQVWLSDESGPLNDGGPVPYGEAIDFALSMLDDAINISNNNTFTVEGTYFNGVDKSSTEFSQLVNAFAARILVNSVRNSTQRDALNWTSVINYVDNSVSSDFEIAGNGWNDNWVNEWPLYGYFPGWGRVDMRVVNLMDPNTIDYWTDTNPVAPQSTSTDNRLTTDFQYLNSQDFIPSRGIYHYSSYRHSRYDWYINANYFGNYPEILKAEMDLYKAEALLRTGDLAGAAAIINAGTRTTRGGLPNVATDAQEIADAIHYERSIELMSTGSGLSFYEMRRENMLQAGTLLHFPVPGKQLQAAGIENYTFGGTSGTPGEDYSISGWND